VCVTIKRRAQFVREPKRRRTCRDLDVKDAPPLMPQHHERVEPAKRQRGHGEEVDGRDGASVVGEVSGR